MPKTKKFIKSIGTQYYILDLIQDQDNNYQVVIERPSSKKSSGAIMNLPAALLAYDQTLEKLENEYAIAAW